MAAAVQRISIDDKFHYIKMRFKGHSRADILKSEIDARHKAVQDKAAELATTLLQRDNTAENTLNPLINEVEKMDFVAAERDQIQNLKKTLQELESIREKLEKHLNSISNDVLKRNAQTEMLRSYFQLLSNTLKNAPNTFFAEDAVLEASQRTNRYISFHRNRYGSSTYNKKQQ